MGNDFFFPPYIGGKYADADNFFNGKKVLVVGHAHYCTGKDEKTGQPNYDEINGCGRNCKTFLCQCGPCPNKNLSWTSGVIDSYLKNPTGKGIDPKSGDKYWRKTYTQFANTFKSNCNKNDFYRSIIFYNFAQQASPKEMGRLEDDIYEKSQKIFNKFLNELSLKEVPDIILVWGKYVKAELSKNENIAINPENQDYAIYKHKLKDIKLVFMQHPCILPKGGYQTLRTIIKGFVPELMK